MAMDQTNNPNLTPLWRVTQITDSQRFDPVTGVVPSKRIDFVTMDGTHSYIIVPNAQFDKESVLHELNDAAMRILEVKTLQAPIIPPATEMMG